MTPAGWPCAAARLTTWPRASRFRRRPSGCVVLLDERQDLRPRRRRGRASEISTSKCPALASTAPSFMRVEVLAAQDVAAAGDGDEDVAALGRVERGQDLEALHPRLERAQRVDLADDDRRAGAAGAQRDAAAGPAVAEHDDRLAGEQQVRRADDPVERGLAGAEAVVERALGGRLVDGEHRAAEVERAHVHEAAARLLGRAAQRARASRAISSAPSSRTMSRPRLRRPPRGRSRVVADVDAVAQRLGDVGLRGVRVGRAQRDLARRRRAARGRGSPSRR